MTDLAQQLANNPLFADLGREREERRSAQVGAMLSHDTQTPEQAVENMNIGQELGLPANVVGADPQVFKRQATQKRATTSLSGAPLTAEWLSDFNNAAIAKDDVENLSWFEKKVEQSPGALTRAAGRGALRLGAISSELEARAAGQKLADFGKSFDDIYAEELAKIGGEAAPASMKVTAMQVAQLRADAVASGTEADRAALEQKGAASLVEAREVLDRAAAIPMNETAERFRDGALANADNSFMGVLSAFASDPEGGLSFVAQVAAESLPILAASTATTALSRTPAAGVGVMAGGSLLLENSNSAMEFLVEEGVDLSTPEAAVLVISNPELMRRAAERGVTRGVIIGLFDAVSGGVAGQTLARSPMGDVVVQGLAQMALGSGGESAAQMASGQELQWQDIVLEGLAELVTAPVEVGGVAGRGFLRQVEGAGYAGTTAQTLAEIDQMAAASKLKQRSVGKFQEALDAQGTTDFYVNPDDVKEYFQAKDVTFDEEAMQAWGIDPQDFAEAEASGRDVPISSSTYAARISGTEDAAWFAENAVMRDGEMSVSQAARFNEDVQGVMEKAFEEAERQRQADEQVRASDVQVYDEIYSQLRSAGRTVDVADNEARVWSSFWRTMGERYGEDPLELARSMGVTIRGPQTPSARVRDNIDIKLNTLRSQGEKALRPSGASLIDFIRGEGGISDVGGEFDNADAPSGLVAETSADVAARRSQPGLDGTTAEGRGKGLDELGRAAIEAGYFPELLGGADIQADGTVVDEAAALLEAIQRELSGEARYPVGQGPDADLMALNEALSERGIDLALSNDDIIAALEGGDGQTYNQGERARDEFDDMSIDELAEVLFAPIDRGPAFDAWAGEGHKYLESGDVNDEPFTGKGPWVMRSYHGTTHQFDEFDSSATGNREGHFGAVNYFTTSETDAVENYAGMGPDLTGRVERRAEELESIIDEVWDELDKSDPSDAFSDLLGSLDLNDNVDISSIDETFIDNDPDEGVDAVALASDLARRELSGGEEILLEVFVRTEKPFVVDAENPGKTPHIEFRDREDLEARAVDRVAEDQGVEVSEIEADRDEYEDAIYDAMWEIEADEPDALFEAMERVANEYDLDASEMYQAAEEFLYDGGPTGSLEKALRESDALRYMEDPETGGMISSHVIAEIIRELGFDSIVLKNANKQFSNMPMGGPTAHIHVFDEFNSNIKSVDNEGAFDRSSPNIFHQGASKKRGSIQLPSGGLQSGQTVINLFQEANLSTFLHESGHFFLEAFTALATSDNAPQAMRDDLAAIHKFLEVDGSKPLETAQHEKWARGFEAYAMEGKAPSLELADAFGRFKAWLTRIYQSVKGLNVKLTPEIREVMDRMLATDAEIKAAREAQEMAPLFTSQGAAGMSPATWNTYQRFARRSVEQAEQALLEKTMSKVRREKEKWWKEERKGVKAEVTSAVNSRREYRLIEMLANQTWIGSEEDVPDFQIDRKELVDAFGDGVLAELSRSQFGGKRAIYGNDGSSLAEVAEFFGFEDPAQMVQILQNTGKKQATIELETDQIMSDRYGDPLNDGSIEEEALAAIHSEQQANTVATEARHLAERAGKSTRNLTSKVFRQRARMMIGRMTVKDATRPGAFLTASRRAAKGAEDAFGRVIAGRDSKDALATAARFKEQQLLNHYLYMESRDLEKMVASKREKMRNYSKASVRKALDGGYIEQIDGILEAYDFRKRSPGQVARTEKLKDYVDRMIEDGRAGELAIDERLMDEANRKHYSRLSVDELRGLFDTIENIDHMGRFKQKLVDAQQTRELQEVATTFAESIKGRFGTGKAGNQSKQVRNFFNLLFSVDTMMVDLDGTELGEVYDLFKSPLDRGQSLEQLMNVEMADAVQDIFSVYTTKQISQMQVGKVIPGGNGHLWSKMEVIALALNTGHQDGRNRVLEKTVHPERRLTQEQLDATLDTLEKADWDFVQSVIDQVGSYWPQLSATHKRRTGTTLKKVDGVPIETKFGTYRGGYYPISYDSQRSIGAAKDEASAWDKFQAAGRGSKIEVKSGMTKARQESSGGRTIDFDLNVALRHMRDTIRVIAMSEVVDNAARIIKHKDVETAFMDAGQTNQFNTLRLFLDDLAMGPVYNTDPINSFARIVKNNFTMAKLAFNFKTVALQVTGITQSAVVVGKRNMVRGYRDYLANPKAAVKMAMEKSPFMAERKSSFQKDIYDQINDIQLSSPMAKRTTKAKNAIGKAGFYPMIRVQFLTVDVPTWISAYDAQKRAGVSDDAAVKYADRIVARSQGSGLYADRNAMERGTLSQNTRQSDFIRLWTTLGSYMVTKMNRGYLAAQKGKRDIANAENAGQMVGSALNMASDLTLLYMAEAIMMGLAYSLLAGDDADEEDLAQFVMTNTATSIIGGVPIVSGVANAFQGYGAGGVLASVLEMPANVTRQIAQGENDAALWRSISDAGGMLTGLPSTATYRAIEGVVRYNNGGDMPLSDMFFGTNPLTR